MFLEEVYVLFRHLYFPFSGGVRNLLADGGRGNRNSLVHLIPVDGTSGRHLVGIVHRDVVTHFKVLDDGNRPSVYVPLFGQTCQVS